MDKFEYAKLENLYRGFMWSWFLNEVMISDGGLIDVLNRLGQEGWELVTVIEYDHASDKNIGCVLKRKIIEGGSSGDI